MGEWLPLFEEDLSDSTIICDTTWDAYKDQAMKDDYSGPSVSDMEQNLIMFGFS